MTTHSRSGKTTVDVPNLTPGALLRLSRLGRELRITGQILSDDLDSTSIVADGPAPAWTTLDGDAMSFSMRHMPKPSSRVDLGVWLGTFAHELGHNLFSPRSGSELMRRVIAAERSYLRGMAQLANIAEDQRQERLLLARFAPWRTYLTAALGHHLVADSETAWLLMTGRTWLPSNVRLDARAKFVGRWGEAMADEVTSLIGDYQHLTDPGDAEVAEAWSILERLHAIFDGAMPTLPRGCVVIEGGEPDTSEPGESVPESADEAGDAYGDPCPDGVPSEGDEEGDDGGSKPTSKPGKSKGSKDVRGDLRKALKDAAKDDLDGDGEASDDLDSILDALDHGRAGDAAEGDAPEGRFEVASDAARRLHHEVGDALLDLKDQSEPGWDRRTDGGRLSVRRLVDPFVPADELFDRWTAGQLDASELEVVLVVDVSGSMQSSTMPLAESVWAIRQAVDDIEGACTVITFDHGPHRILAAGGDRPDDRMFVPTATGGTVPTSALREAYRLLADSSARNRLLIVLTDGSWYSNDGESSIEAARAMGVVTVCALLGDDAGRDGHGCEHVSSIDEPFELALLFRRVAAARIGAW